MAKGLIDVSISGFEDIQRTFEYLPKFARDEFASEIADFLVDELQKYDPPQRSVSRKRAYGVTFFTPRQRRWFFWALKGGRISVPYRRTRKMMKAWRKRGKGETVSVVNNTPGVPFVMGDIFQSRHERLVGWDTIGAFVEKRSKTILAKGNQIINTTLRKLGWK